jgi:hypothetical protein
MAAPNPPTAASAPAAPPAPRQREIRVVSHCGLFYWWPVWLVGFIMWIITMFSGHRLAVVPHGTASIKEAVERAPTDREKEIAKAKKIDPNTKRDALVFPLGEQISPPDKNKPHILEDPYLHMSADKNLGVVFVAWLLLVIVITNIPLRGLWSVIVIVLVLLIVVLFAFFEVWNTVLNWISILDIRINAAGYFVISSVLFLLWLVVMLVFDRQIYMIFTPGQVRVVQEIGDAETSYDTSGITVQKQRSDLFRHWILGLGSGDLIVKTSGANPQEIHMPNVLFIGRKVSEIEEMLRERPVVMGRPT